MSHSIVVFLLAVISGFGRMSDCLPVMKHVGIWNEPPARVPTNMMFDSPIVGNGDIGMTFGGSPTLTTFYISSNSFWSANQQVDARPNFEQRPGGAESYTQIRVGDVQLSITALKDAGYQASQDLYNAFTNATYSSSDCVVDHKSYITSGDINLVITSITAKGGKCGNATIQLRTGYVEGKFGNVTAGSLRSANSSEKTGSEKTAEKTGSEKTGSEKTGSAVMNDTLVVSRNSVSTRHNSLTASSCWNAGQQANSQRWTTTTTTTQTPTTPTTTTTTTTPSSSTTATTTMATPANKTKRKTLMRSGEVNSTSALSLSLVDGRCIQTVVVDGVAKLTIGETRGSTSTPCDEWHLEMKGASPPRPAPSPSPTPPLPNVPGYVGMPGFVGGQPETEDYHCSATTAAECVPQAAHACNTTSWCTSFAIYNCRGLGPPPAGHSPTCYTQLYTQNETSTAYLDDGWNLFRKQTGPSPPPSPPPPLPPLPAGYVLVNNDGACAHLDNNTEFIVLSDCTYSTRWLVDTASKHLYASNTNHTWGGGKCLTAVEPNPLVVAAMAMRLVDNTGAAVPSLSTTTVDFRSSAIVVDLDALDGEEHFLITAVVTKGNCTGCDVDASNSVSSAVLLLDQNVASISSRADDHSKWWDDYWNTGAVIDLGPKWKQVEAFYYGMHYQIGSASRPNRFAPGLWGPWLTAETCGWSGDYTLNYNFEANYYGVFSDNRPELVQPYFQTILNHVDLGLWRASMAKWGDGASSATPGFWAQDFNHMDQLSTDGSGFVDAAYKGIQFPTHFSPWKHFYFVSDWGQKNIGGFSTKAFMDYYDYTSNTTFLADTLYPLTKLNAEFYASYMQKIDGKYNVMHSCAMEGCGAQGPHTASNIVVSNNPPFDLAFVKRTFRSLLAYSVTLDIDHDLRANWSEYLLNVADYPLTKDENGDTVFAQASLNAGPTSTETDGFPNASKCVWKAGRELLSVEGDTSECGNARYPITFFNAMHPGEDVDLASDDTIVTIGRRTTSAVNAINDFSPTNGLCMAWPASARVVESSDALLYKFDLALTHTMMNNFIPYIDNRPTGGSGCNVENSGATVAVNDLLASVHGHGDTAALRVFPGGWTVNETVSFENIRVRGAFTVSASAKGSTRFSSSSPSSASSSSSSPSSSSSSSSSPSSSSSSSSSLSSPSSSSSSSSSPSSPSSSPSVDMMGAVVVKSLSGNSLAFIYDWGKNLTATPVVTTGPINVAVSRTTSVQSMWIFNTSVGAVYSIL